MKSILCIISMSALLAMLVFLSGCLREEKEYIPVEQVIHFDNGTVTHKFLAPNPNWRGNIVRAKLRKECD